MKNVFAGDPSHTDYYRVGASKKSRQNNVERQCSTQNNTHHYNCVMQNTSNCGTHSLKHNDDDCSQSMLFQPTPSLYLLLQRADPHLYRTLITPAPVAAKPTGPTTSGDSDHVASDAQRLFDCANSLYIQRVSCLRSQIVECTDQLRQTKGLLEASQQQVRCLQDERDRLDSKLQSQAAQYEDRLTELHSVIAELRRRAEKASLDFDRYTIDKQHTILRDVDEDNEEGNSEGLITSSITNSTGDDGQHNQSVNSCRSPADTDGEEISSSASVDAVDGDHTSNRVINPVCIDDRQQGSLVDDAGPLFSRASTNGLPFRGIHRTMKLEAPDASQPLTQVTVERDQIASQLNVHSSSHLDDSKVPTSSIQRVTQTSGFSAELPGYSVRSTLLAQNPTGHAIPSPSVDQHTSSFPPPPTSQTSSTVAAVEAYCSTNNLYDVPEPDWLTSALQHYHQTTTQRTTNSSDSAMISNTFDLGCVTEAGVLSASGLLALLASLAQYTPFPRLAEAAHCGQLVTDRLLASLSRLRSDCLLLQVNLSEAKANADQQQCRLNQIEACWSALLRAFQLSDASLEVADSLNQLHATELAMLVYREARRFPLSWRSPHSTMSSSTSSSSCAPSTTATASGVHPRSSRTAAAIPANQSHGYAVYAIPSDSELNANSSNAGPAASLNMRTLKAFRHQAEVSAYSLLQRYDALVEQTSVSQCSSLTASTGLTKGPHTSTSFLLSRHRRLGHLTSGIGPLSPGLLSTHSQTTAVVGASPLANISSSLSLTGTTHSGNANTFGCGNPYSNSWYASLTRPANQLLSHGGQPILDANKTIQTPAQAVTTSNNSVSSLPMTGISLPGGRLSTVHRPSPPSHPCQPCGVGGWQTPDSGAGSSSTTNEAAGQQDQHPNTDLFSTLLMMPVGNLVNQEFHTFSAVLDVLPPVWGILATQRSSALLGHADSDSDTSDEASEGNLSIPQSSHLLSTPRATMEAGFTYRPEEYRLRTLLHQLTLACRLLRNTVPDQLSESISLSEDVLVAEKHPSQNTSVTKPQQKDAGETNNTYVYTNINEVENSVQSSAQLSISPLSGLGNLPLSVLLENTVLLQENCSVKEERADLKARLYLLEKELQANRLKLESRAVAENAVRAHLTAVQAELNRQSISGITATTGTTRSTVLDQNKKEHDETDLLRIQVQELLQAFESLRHNSEVQQFHNEELVDELKRANTALITAFEKAKRKYLTRIHKLENQLSVRHKQQQHTTLPSTLPPIITGGAVATARSKPYRSCELHIPPPPPPPTTPPPPPPGRGLEQHQLGASSLRSVSTLPPRRPPASSTSQMLLPPTGKKHREPPTVHF